MKTYANNPPVKYSELNGDQKDKALNKIMKIEGLLLTDLWHLSRVNPKFTDSFEFFITSPTSVAVKKK